MRAKVVKNKVAAPFRVAEFDIMFNEGISRVADLVDLGVLYGILKKSGAFYSWDGTRLGAGPGELEGLSQGEQVYGFVPREPHPGGRGVTLAACAGFGEWGGGGDVLGGAERLGRPSYDYGLRAKLLSSGPPTNF